MLEPLSRTDVIRYAMTWRAELDAAREEIAHLKERVQDMSRESEGITSDRRELKKFRQEAARVKAAAR
jgi:hypothetical protein